MTNIDDFDRVLRDSHAQSQGIVDTMANPLPMLDGSLRVQAANCAFFDTFQVDRYETVAWRIYELGNVEHDVPGVRRA